MASFVLKNKHFIKQGCHFTKQPFRFLVKFFYHSTFALSKSSKLILTNKLHFMIFFFLSLLFLLSSCSNSGNESQVSNDKESAGLNVIQIQPYDNFTQAEAKQLKIEFEKEFERVLGTPVNVEILPNRQLPESCFYKPRQRYRAEKVIASQKSFSKPAYTIVGLTHKDISTTVHGEKDFGIMGLSYRPGNSLIVSSFRTRKGQLWKVCCHEFCHSIGLPHCPNDDIHCIIANAHGKNTFDQKNELCADCRAHAKKIISGEK